MGKISFVGNIKKIPSNHSFDKNVYGSSTVSVVLLTSLFRYSNPAHPKKIGDLRVLEQILRMWIEYQTPAYFVPKEGVCDPP